MASAVLERHHAVKGNILAGLGAKQPDALLALIGAFRSDPRSAKIDVGVGVYRDAKGETPVFRSIKVAEARLLEAQTSKAYLGPEGDVGFFEALLPLVLGIPVAAGGVRVVPHDRMRLAIAENMLKSVTVAPHVTAVFEADFSAIIAHRKKHKATFEREGANLTFTAYVIAACVEAMRVAPTINSRWYDDRLEVFDDVNIGVGTALGEKGLVVPVVNRTQALSLRGIAAQLTDQVSRAREGKLTPADVRGGTFTISNHGVSGSLVATPIIIAQPQSAILGVGKLEKRVVVRTIEGVDTIQIRPMSYVSLTIDHRVVDGHQANAWLTRFVEVIENWPLDG